MSSTVAAAILGSLVGGKLNETFGRKPVILCSAVIFIMGSVVMGLAPDYYILLIGRSLVGIGVGISSMTGEISPTFLNPVEYPRRVAGVC